MDKTEIKELMLNLFSREHKDMKRGNERISQLLSLLGNPHIKYPTIHIAGTNGKGSVSSLVASILQECGYKVGLYTSPHIVDFTERIKINNENIKYESIEEIYNKLSELALDIGASFFEISSAMAFEYFRSQHVDIAIIETGIGGTYDATNIINPILSILTTITKDHTDILGNTLEEIAKDKGGIIKPKSIAILQDKNPIIIDLLQNIAIEQDTMLYLSYDFPVINIIGYDENLNMLLNVYFPENIKEWLEHLPDFSDTDGFDNKKMPVSKNIKTMLQPYKVVLPLPGQHQVENVRTAICATHILSGMFNITLDGILNGLNNVRKNTNLHFRIELVSKENPYLIVDVAHNTDSVQKLISTLKEATLYNEFDFVFGSMKDKDIDGMLQLLYPVCSTLRLYQMDIFRAANIDDIKNKAEKIGFKNVKKYESPHTVLKDIFASKSPTVICGSFYLIDDLRKAYWQKTGLPPPPN